MNLYQRSSAAQARQKVVFNSTNQSIIDSKNEDVVKD